MRAQALWRECRGLMAALLAGLLLRVLFVSTHPRFSGDTLVYGDLAHNIVAHHVYGFNRGSPVRPTLIRLPGYPLFLAGCFLLFGTGNYVACALGAGGGRSTFRVLLALPAARHACGASVPGTGFCGWRCFARLRRTTPPRRLTETLSVFCVVASCFGLLAAWQRALRAGRGANGRKVYKGLFNAGPEVWRRRWARALRLPRFCGRTRASCWQVRRCWRCVGSALACGTGAVPSGRLSAELLWRRRSCVRRWGFGRGGTGERFHVIQPLAPKYGERSG